MQQLGCTSSHSLDLCKHLIKDFFKSSEQKGTLDKLGQLAPRFTANFMTGVAEHYLKLDMKNGFSSPPPLLLEIITNWVLYNLYNYYHILLSLHKIFHL